MDSAGEFKRCTRCATIVPADASFCGKCGAVVGTSCPHCQKAVDPKTEFCCYCGQTLASKTAPPAPTPPSAAPTPPAIPELAKKTDWTKGGGNDTPVVILHPDRGDYSSRWYGAAAICCVVGAGCLFWQWGMSSISQPAARTNPEPGTQIPPGYLNSPYSRYTPPPGSELPPAYLNRPRRVMPSTPPASGTTTQRTPNGFPAPSAPPPTPAPFYRPPTDPGVPPSIVIRHGIPGPSPGAMNPGYAEAQRNQEGIRRGGRPGEANRSPRQPGPGARPGQGSTPRGHWENGRWITDGR